MTVDLYMYWRTPYNPAVAGLTVEAWEDSLFSHSPVGNPNAYPPASSPTATTTTDSSGNCELTGLTAGTNYYVSIIDENNKPWFVFCPSTALGNLSTTRRQFSIVQGPVPVAAGSQTLTQIGGRIYLGTTQHSLSSPTTVQFNKTDYVDSAPLGVTASYPEIAAGPSGIYVVSANVLLQATSASAGLVQMLISVGGRLNSEVSVAFPGGTGNLSLNFSDSWFLDTLEVVEVQIITSDDAAYKIFGNASRDQDPSSLALSYAGGTLS